MLSRFVSRQPRPARTGNRYEWDLVIVDEAHHLQWSPDSASLEYTAVDLISRAAKGLLLLTATPEQLGRAGHFARLRLLDPNRFHDFEAFIEEESRFEHVVDAVNRLLTSNEEEEVARAEIRTTLGVDEDDSDDDLIEALLDRHGTGRVLFRNVRSSVAGFPARVPMPAQLTGDDEARLDWLIELVDDRPADKFLVICARKETAIELGKQLETRTAARFALFHEDLDLVACDRAAAYFAETERGAQLLICSEIGSEGRNFQFAHNLVLFDLPKNPDLLEQRIGRLDRIGQARDVNIHIPFLADSATARRYRWYSEGLSAFEHPQPGRAIVIR
ncbi:MAG: helicase-related protein [Gammaproteobacteria bacterium]|nr:helicase-related protein [Gammaproteobacteria bacterium]